MRLKLLVAVLALPGIAVAAPGNGIDLTTYSVGAITVHDLGTLGGSSSRANDINDGGQVVGWSYDGNGKKNAVIWLDGAIYSIHDNSPAFGTAEAFGINNDNVVVGEYTEAAAPYHTRAFYYYPGIWMEPMWHNDASPGLGFEWETGARAINSSHRIAGWAERIPDPDLPPPPDTQGLCHSILPVTWLSAAEYPNAVFCLADFANDNIYGYEGLTPRAYDVNDYGSVVGTDGMTTQYSMFLRKGGVTLAVPAPAGMAQNNIFGRAYGINNKHWVVGAYGYAENEYPDYPANTRAFFWDGATSSSQSLGVLSGGKISEAFEINEQKMVAGGSERLYNYSGGSVVRSAGFIWHPDFGMKQLPALANSSYPGNGPFGFVLVPNSCYAYSLNNRKSGGLVQAVGECSVNGVKHAVRWDIQVHATTYTFP
jgi:probable HAF family extracellular repeat protein